MNTKVLRIHCLPRAAHGSPRAWHAAPLHTCHAWGAVRLLLAWLATCSARVPELQLVSDTGHFSTQARGSRTCTDLRAGLGAHGSPNSSRHSASLAATACCATAAPSGAPVPARLRAVPSICAARCCTSRTRAAPTAPAVLAAPAVALAPAQRALVHAAAKHATSRLSSSA